MVNNNINKIKPQMFTCMTEGVNNPTLFWKSEIEEVFEWCFQKVKET